MKTADFDFELPSDLIAQRPAVPRESARLLDAQEGLIDRTIRDLAGLLHPGDLMVFNDTKVIPALLSGVRVRDVTGSKAAPERKVSVTLHKSDGDGLWRAFAKPARRLAAGDQIVFADDFCADVVEKRDKGETLLRFAMTGADFHAALRRHGRAPLPPYIKRPELPDAQDHADYQTLFAARDGAVAAPTAGLHFTPELMTALADAGIATAPLTLHVGAGTFLLVTVENVADHQIHSEIGEISPATADAVNATHTRGGRVLAVGTTSLRLLESAIDEGGTVQPFTGDTSIFITPGYRFGAVDLLLTNFHLPRSTLFMLVSAFAGTDDIRAAYDHAIAQRYRFYSYGDAMLLKCANGRAL
ncbi:MAG: tRNA preQ1(34) S-adenosylmethionine ribosyltransferase-isomerase QueA [Alphaproteobacteria bacterium]|nr:tRNA preQ1(34) S-adenosylmethionine ribosyltransferase-isomerase QueA [Alphaproteobacteria bacterium]